MSSYGSGDATVPAGCNIGVPRLLCLLCPWEELGKREKTPVPWAGTRPPRGPKLARGTAGTYRGSFHFRPHLFPERGSGTSLPSTRQLCPQGGSTPLNWLHPSFQEGRQGLHPAPSPPCTPNTRWRVLRARSPTWTNRKSEGRALAVEAGRDLRKGTARQGRAGGSAHRRQQLLQGPLARPSPTGSPSTWEI